ncbi:protein FAM151B-like [Glandiceps talaboti]
MLLHAQAETINNEQRDLFKVGTLSTEEGKMDSICNISEITDGLNVTWAHAVNSEDRLVKALQTNCTMLEADILLNTSGVPIMAHPPDNDSDITLHKWVDMVLQSRHGIKLDVKELAALELTLLILISRADDLKQRPLWLNADIIQGPNGDEPINASLFIDTCCQHLPTATLSVGWTCNWTKNKQTDGYTWDMIYSMLKYVKNMHQPITFPVCAVFMKTSLDKFLWLLGESKSFSLTLWSHPHHPIHIPSLLQLRSQVDKNRVFYDFPSNQIQQFRNAVEEMEQQGI